MQFVETAEEGATSDRPSGVSLALPLAAPLKKGAVKATGVYITNFRGVIYALDRAKGSLLWRRPVGERLVEVAPTRVEDDLLLIDHRHGDLLRVASKTGKLAWRVALEDPAEGGLFQPVVAGDRILVASESGKLWSVDAFSGARSGYAQFAQPLRTAAAAGPAGRRVYVLGRQSSVYTLDSVTLECLSVQYTGHAPGQVAIAPIVIDKRVYLFRDAGKSTSVLDVFRLDGDGIVAEHIDAVRQDGIAATAHAVGQRRLVSGGRQGAVYLYEGNPPEAPKPLTLIASRRAEKGPPSEKRIVARESNVWIGGVGLLRTAASLADSQLVVRAIPDRFDGDRFLGAMEISGAALFHSRVRKGLPGLVCAATDMRSGEALWQTELACPPLAAPRFSSSLGRVLATTSTGATHVIGPPAIRAKRSAEPTATAPVAAYAAVVHVNASTNLFFQKNSSEWFATMLSPRPTARRVSLAGELACQPHAFAGGVLASLRLGQIQQVNAVGRSIVAPFQPTIEIGKPVDWTPAGSNEDYALLTDGAAKAYCLQVTEEALIGAGESQLPGEPLPIAPAISGQQGAVALAGGKLALYDLPNLAEAKIIELPAEIAWGPFATESGFVVATEEGQLHGVSQGVISGSMNLDQQRLIGSPVVSDGEIIVVSREGVVLRLDPTRGEELSRVDLGQRVATGATAYASRLLAAAEDGSVLVFNRP